MDAFKRAVALCAALSLSACGGAEVSSPPSPDSEALVEQSNAVTSGTSQGCAFSVTYASIPGALPQAWHIRLSRSASVTCPFGADSVVVGTTYTTPRVSLAANDLGVAVCFAGRVSPSVKGAIHGVINHMAPDTMTSVRDTNISVMYGTGNVTSCELSIDSDGTTLTATGSKTGPLPGETGSGSYYVAHYADFFTSTTEPTYFAY
jgi:hypothetical protein